MRKISSLFRLFIRISFPWLLMLLLVAGLLEGALFHFALEGASAASAAEGTPLPGMEPVLTKAGVVWVVGVGFLLAQLLLVIGPWPERSSMLLRLRVSHRARFFTQSLYHFLCCCLLWMAQILVAWGLCLLYVGRMGPEAASNQTIFLAFHRSNLLHTLLPLGNGFLWARNLLAMAALSLGLSFHTLRKPAFYPRMLIMLRFILVYYALGPKGLELWFMVFDTLVSLVLIGWALYKVFWGKEADDEAD